MKPKLSLIVALAEETFGIGYENKLPWRIPGEMKYFKQVTSHTSEINSRNAVIMGRKTWESVPKKFRPLSDRLNIVVTSRNASEVGIEGSQNALIASSLELAIERAEKSNVSKIFLIGGASLYFYALKNQFVKEMYITMVSGSFKVDTYFPLFDLKNSPFRKVNNEFLTNLPKVESCIFEKYVLKSSKVLKPIESTAKKGEAENISDNIVSKDAIDMNILKSNIDNNLSTHEEYQYLDLVLECMMRGNKKMDRTKVGTLSLFGKTMRYSLEDDKFPLLTTKRTFFRGVAEELLFFISGKTDNKLLREKKIHIWDLNCTREFLDNLGMTQRKVDDLGPVYGFQWRHFGAQYTDYSEDYTGKGVDQLKQLIKTIKTNPNSRRMILSAWNVADLPKMVLPPCHMFAQFYVHDGKLSCQMYQRSADLGLGVPFNIASYALLTRLLAQCCDLTAGEFVHVIGDCHVYSNHVEALKVQLKRKPRDFPILKINPEKKDIDSFKYEDFELVGYKPHKKIKLKMAV